MLLPLVNCGLHVFICSEIQVMFPVCCTESPVLLELCGCIEAFVQNIWHSKLDETYIVCCCCCSALQEVPGIISERKGFGWCLDSLACDKASAVSRQAAFDCILYMYAASTVRVSRLIEAGSSSSQGSTGGLKTGKMPTSGVNFATPSPKSCSTQFCVGSPLDTIFLRGYTIFVLLKHECSSVIKWRPERYLQA